MRRFREFEIELIKKEDEEIGVSGNLLSAKISIDLYQVESFREQTDGEDEFCFVCVYMRSGESFTLVNYDYESFKILMKEVSFQLNN